MEEFAAKEPDSVSQETAEFVEEIIDFLKGIKGFVEEIKIKGFVGEVKGWVGKYFDGNLGFDIVAENEDIVEGTVMFAFVIVVGFVVAVVVSLEDAVDFLRRVEEKKDSLVHMPFAECPKK
eukprot:CAMPEP_0201481690 /NCGR_PEP_ID=MMETSP0151_2-20130828/5957_1 /ASSEMBLY_ACC=CAM_ASM_000257 /TAXON_ID=200890 /ORGANISM="Paramoeba atlantica, Strain 621/1 / CCAP 1560/9" /LENGTH=120 /DNA_ID=CAMNT_0047864019 /DNA_START=798 /DNA_END=1160 /DNA_ORIENTATION=-